MANTTRYMYVAGVPTLQRTYRVTVEQRWTHPTAKILRVEFGRIYAENDSAYVVALMVREKSERDRILVTRHKTRAQEAFEHMKRYVLGNAARLSLPKRERKRKT